MKLKVTDQLKTLSNEPMYVAYEEMDSQGQKTIRKEPLTVQKAICDLLNMETNENRLTEETKNKAFQIQLKMYSSNEVELTVDDRAFIQKRAWIFYPTEKAGILVNLLEDKEEKLEVE